MTDNTQTAGTQTDTTAKTAKPKTVADMPQKQVFATPEEAEDWIQTAMERYTDFIPMMNAGKVVIPQMVKDEDGDGSLNREYYGVEGMATMVAVLKNKGKSTMVDGNKVTTPGSIRGIIIAPVPTLELLMMKADGMAFVRTVLNKELNHRMVANLRDAENLVSVADQIPLTLAGYLASTRDGGGINEGWEETYKEILDLYNKNIPIWQKRRFNKQEFRKSCESKAYALDSYPEIEEAGKNGSLFVAAINMGINACTRRGLDATIYQRWLDTRDQTVMDADDDEDDDDGIIDFEALAEKMLAEPDAPTTDAPTDGTDQPGIDAPTENEPATT